MKCRECREALLDGSVGRPETAAHLASCAECGALQELVGALGEAGERMRQRDLPARAVQAALARAAGALDAPRRPAQPTRLFRPAYAWATALAAVLVAAFAIATWRARMPADTGRDGLALTPSQAAVLEWELDARLGGIHGRMSAFRSSFLRGAPEAELVSRARNLRATIALRRSDLENELVALRGTP